MGGERINKPYSYDITYGGIVGAALYTDDYTGPALSGTVNTLPEGVVFLPSAGYRYGFKVGNAVFAFCRDRDFVIRRAYHA